MIGRKQVSTNEQWLRTVENIERIISSDEVEKFAARSVEDIRRVTEGKKAAYGWSGGKDSIVLSSLCERAGVRACFFGHCDLEFMTFLRWALAHKPEGCKVINTHVDMEWLSEHPDMLFVDDAKRLNRWYAMVQRRAFSDYYASERPDIIIVGHRTMDGNVCGKGSFIRKESGEVRYSPIAGWPHEAVLGYLHYHGLELPPLYGWENGYVFGPTPWPIWGHPKNEAEGWAMISELEPSILVDAAQYFPGAACALREGARA